jgi:hypothetical protein
VEDLGEITLLKRILKGIGCESLDWIYLPQDRGQWQALMYTVMNTKVP